MGKFCMMLAAALIPLLLVAFEVNGQQAAVRACVGLGPDSGRCGKDSHCCGTRAVCHRDSLFGVVEVDIEPLPKYCCGKLGAMCYGVGMPDIDVQCCQNPVTLAFASTSDAGSCQFYPGTGTFKCCARFGTQCDKDEDCCPENPPRRCRRQSNGRPSYCA